ncbi:MAG: hypothetical protein D3914_02060 [Candidatus Electrothrix sp. LOE2]|nr:hypothetical protein [Candidatus Electrothrix sp. LOE2]
MPPPKGNVLHCAAGSGDSGYSGYSITLRLGNRVEGKSGAQTRTVAGTLLSGNRKLSLNAT